MKPLISRIVWILSFVSLFADVASEMLYPVMPVFLKSIGFSVLLIGILEGVAEATAGLSKGYFGNLSDKTGRRVPFVTLGYLLSAISKPLFVLILNPFWILFTRTTDRLGKGLRTGARDAILSGEATPETKGRVFGLHRSMDTLGAVIGPCIALIYLYYFPRQYKNLFLFALLPGLLAVALTFLIKEKPLPAKKPASKINFFEFFRFYKTSPLPYQKVVAGVLIFTLFNSSDVFLLLKVKEAGITDEAVIGVYIFYNLIYAVFGYPMGQLADKMGFRKTFILGLLLFAAVYAGMAVTSNLYIFLLLFFLYGIFSAANESVAKAWVTNLVKKDETATATGTLAGFQSLATMFASILAGFIWTQWGAFYTFAIASAVAFLTVLYFLSAFKTEKA